MQVKQLGKNEIELCFINGTKILLSYETPVAAIEMKDNEVTLIVTEKRHSNTTSKHVKKWVGEASHFIVTQDYLDDLLFNIT